MHEGVSVAYDAMTQASTGFGSVGAGLAGIRPRAVVDRAHAVMPRSSLGSTAAIVAILLESSVEVYAGHVARLSDVTSQTVAAYQQADGEAGDGLRGLTSPRTSPRSPGADGAGGDG